MNSKIPIDEHMVQIIRKKFNDIQTSISPEKFARIQNIIENAILRKYFITKDIYDILDLLEEKQSSAEVTKNDDNKTSKKLITQKHFPQKRSNNFKQTLIHMYDYKRIRFKRALVYLLISHRKSRDKTVIKNH